MKLVRNTTPDGTCKYALVNLRKLTMFAHMGGMEKWPAPVLEALHTLEQHGVLEWGKPGARDEFFAIKLADRNSASALLAYATSCEERDPEFAAEVRALASRAGLNSPHCKDPD